MTAGTDQGPISDAAVAAVLRPFVRATRPVLHGLRESDPFGLRNRVVTDVPDGAERSATDRLLDALASVQAPGTAAWAQMDREQRSRWWVRRVGRFTTLLAAVPGLGGALASRLPVSKALGAAGQGLLLVAIAGEYGVRDEGPLVALLGSVLFRRDLDTSRDLTEDEERAAQAGAAEITAPLADDRPTLHRVGSAVWRLGRALFAVEDELDRRPHGRFYHGWLAMLPVVGMAGKYLGEWAGLKRAARQAQAWLAVEVHDHRLGAESVTFDRFSRRDGDHGL
ncbi:MAG: hypothetical protein ACT4RN_19990 [Pseudonocardia sp.]